MIYFDEEYLIAICIEAFLYGLYSGIFAMYLNCVSKNSRTISIFFYALCILYVLSTVNVVCDLGNILLQTHIGNAIKTISDQNQPAIIVMLISTFQVGIVQAITSGCCDFIAQCILIYRCWIVWSRDIRVVIIPSLLVFTYFAVGLASVGVYVTDFLTLSWSTKSLPIFPAPSESVVTVFPSSGLQYSDNWASRLTLTSIVVSMTVNVLVTSLIVFKILRVFMEVKATSTSVERTLGATRGSQYRHVIFVIIESGMALFIIQVVRVGLIISPVQFQQVAVVPGGVVDLVIGMNQMLNGITPTLIFVRVSMKLSFDDKESFLAAAGSFRFADPPSNSNSTGSTSSVRSEGQSEGQDDDGTDLCPTGIV